MRVRLILSFILIWAGSSTTAFAGNAIDLVIPIFEVRNATMEEVLTKLRQWGVLISLEKLPSDNQRNISIQLKEISIAEVLDSMMKADSRYSWTVYESELRPRLDR